MAHSTRTLLFSVLLLLTLGASAPVRAQERYLVSVTGGAALPLTEPDTTLYGVGAFGVVAGSVSFERFFSFGVRLEGGFLSDGPPPGNHRADPAVGAWGVLGLTARFRPLAELIDDGRRTTGLYLEIGAGGAVTGELVRPAFTAELGWGIAVGDFVLAPSIGLLHVQHFDDPVDDRSAFLARAAVTLTLGDPPPPPPEERVAPPSDRDGDGLLDQDDFCPDEPEDRDDFQDDDGCPDRDDDADGILDGDDACRLTPEDVDGHDDTDGCPEEEEELPPSDRDHDGFLDEDDTCPDEPETVNGVEDEDGCPDEGLVVLEGDRVVLDDAVLFDFDRARVRHGARPILEAVVQLFRAHPEWDRVRIEGHADTRGEETWNQQLSERRAHAVRSVLVSMGLPDTRIECEGFGEARPRADGDTEDAYQLNRRVEIVMIDDAGPLRTAPVPRRRPAREATTTIARFEGDAP
jgi:outer membrane protein OmpA-like peptidoglycan-associated protein